jgi:hypothetical protein
VAPDVVLGEPTPNLYAADISVYCDTIVCCVMKQSGSIQQILLYIPQEKFSNSSQILLTVLSTNDPVTGFIRHRRAMEWLCQHGVCFVFFANANNLVTLARAEVAGAWTLSTT